MNRRNDAIVLLLPETWWGHDLQAWMHDVESCAMSIGRNILARFAGNSRERTVSSLLDFRPAGVVDFAVLSPADHERLEAEGILCVPRGRGDGFPSLHSSIARLQVEALLPQRSRQLWFASLRDERHNAAASLRWAALAEYCAARGYESPKSITFPLDLDEAVSAVSTLSAESASTGVACYDDDVALAVLAAAREMDIEIPGTLSVIGVHDTAAGRMWSPALTSIRIDVARLVEAASLDLHVRLSGHSTPPHRDDRLQLVTLVPGETTPVQR